MLKVVIEQGSLLEYGSDEIKDNFDIVLNAVQKPYYELCVIQFASDRLRSNREIVQAAIIQDPMALKFVPKNLCDDYDTVFIKVNATPNVKLFNVLTPDGDKANSIFRINPTGLYEIDCTIFDRWGTKVTTFNRASNIDWDGAIWNANEAEPGTYYYVLTYRTRQDSVSKTFTETNFIQVVK
jgi:gliding motility-associated-like protein